MLNLKSMDSSSKYRSNESEESSDTARDYQMDNSIENELIPKPKKNSKRNIVSTSGGDNTSNMRT